MRELTQWNEQGISQNPQLVLSSESADDIFMEKFSFHLPKLPPQRLLFSATLTDNPRKLSLLSIYNPLVVRVSQETAEDDEEVNSVVQVI